jgi:hypothetical protein
VGSGGGVDVELGSAVISGDSAELHPARQRQRMRIRAGRIFENRIEQVSLENYSRRVPQSCGAEARRFFSFHKVTVGVSLDEQANAPEWLLWIYYKG